MNKPTAVFLALMGAVVLALAVADYAAARRRAEAARQKVIELVNSYRFGTADRPFEEEWETVNGEFDRQVRGARLRMQVGGLVAVALIVVSLASYFAGRGKKGIGREAPGATGPRA